MDEISYQNLKKIFKVIFSPRPYSLTEMVKKYFGHPRRGVRLSVKIRLKTVAKSTSEISLEVTPNLIPTRKTEIFWESQKGTIGPRPFQNRGVVPKTHQALLPE